jgi:hypothetical protein
LGRRDDLYSWFYSMFELWAGQLPWSQHDDKQAVYGTKCCVDITRILPGMPDGLKSVYRLIRRLERDEAPNYRLLTAFLVDAMREAGASWSDPYEWEHIDVSSLTSLTLRPQDGDETQIPDELPEPVMPARVFVPFSADPQRQFDARLQGQIIMKRRGN